MRATTQLIRRSDASILPVVALSACVLAACVLASQARAQPTPTPIVRDHRVQAGAPTPTPKVALRIVANALAKYTVENLHSPQLVPRGPIPGMEVEWRCPACSSSESLKGVTVEIWHTAAGGSPKLVGTRFNVELKGQGGNCSGRETTCVGVPAGQFPAAEGAFLVKLMRDNSVSSSSFDVVPTALKIFGPTLRDHR